MPLFQSGQPITGGASDDFLFGFSGAGINSTMNGSAGDDLLYGDFGPFISSQFTTAGTAQNLIATANIWSLQDNPDIVNASSVAHMSAYVAPAAGTTAWYAVTVTAGQTISIDIDYGAHGIGGFENTEVNLIGPNGTTVVANNNDALATSGGLGSTSAADAFLTYSFTSAGTYFIQVGAASLGAGTAGNGVDRFAAGAEFLMHVSLTGQAANPTAVNGNDNLSGGTGNDILHGMGGNDTLSGDDGNDAAYGGAGNDTVYGGAGLDILFGGTGNDTLGLDGADTAYGGSGDDLFVSINADGASFGGDGNDTFQLYDFVIFGVPYNPGNFDAGAGPNGGSADRFEASQVGLSITVDLQAGTYTHLGLTRTMLNVEQVFSGGAADSLIGNAANNILDGGASADTIFGGAGNDTLIGGFGNDTLNGGTGNDLLRGGIGDDRYVVDAKGDVVVEGIGDGGADIVFVSASYVLATGVQVEQMQTTSSVGTGAINLSGNALAQRIFGNAGANRLEDGLGVADTLTGGAGNDTYIVHNTGTLIVEGAGGGTVDVLAASVSFVLAADDNIEQMQTTFVTGVGAINLTGNALAQRIFGNAGANRIDGKGGIDVLNGGAGSDVFVFSTAAGAANVDRIQGFVSADQIEIENAVFTGLIDTNAPLTSATFTFNNTGLATLTGHRIIYQTTTGFLFYDADGNTGPAASVHFATVDLGTVLAANDFTVI